MRHLFPLSRHRSGFRRSGIIFLFFVFCPVLLTGCLARTPEPEPAVSGPAVSGPEQGVGGRGAAADPAAAFSGPLSLYDVMAVAVLRGLDAEEDRLNRAVLVPADGRFESLKRLAAAAGYPAPAADTAPALGTSPRELRMRDIAALWDVLDYSMARGAPQMDGPAGRRDRAFHNLLLRARETVYRAAMAETLLPDIRRALDRGEEALNTLKLGEIADPGQNWGAARAQLIAHNRDLWRMSRELAPARTELAVLLGRSAREDVRMIPVLSSDSEADLYPETPLAPRGLEFLALTFRENPGMGARPVNTRLTAARRKLVRLMTAEAGGEAGGEWWNAGMTLAMELASVPVAPPDLADQAAVVQVHLARKREDLAREALRESGRYRPRKTETRVPTKTRVEDLSRELTEIRRETNRLQVERDYFMRALELAKARHRVWQSAGMDELPASPRSLGAAALSAMLRERFAEWDRTLHSAYAAYDQGRLDTFRRPSSAGSEAALPPLEFSGASDPGDISGPSAAPKAGPGAGPDTDPDTGWKPARPATSVPPDAASAETPRPAASPARAASASRPVPASGSGAGASAFRKGNAVVIKASAAARNGRTSTRSVSVYRDVVTIHERPDIQSPVKGQGLIGEEYPLLGWSPRGWLKIRMSDGSAGWLPTKYVKPVGGARTAGKIPAAEKTGAPEPGESMPREVVTTKRANLRRGPGLNHEVKYITPRGTRFPVIRTRGEWHLVRDARGSIGWLHKSVIR
ncbi:MAG: hypothetical protein CSB33_03165 [Desulfobacterales bacterium]|nr:MAG: hypothetical protein CSB33_03165 [Desulfobacterales bacterium]